MKVAPDCWKTIHDVNMVGDPLLLVELLDGNVNEHNVNDELLVEFVLDEVLLNYLVLMNSLLS